MTNSNILSVTKAAQVLGVTRQAAYIAVKNGRIPAEKCPNTKKWLITFEDVQSYKQNKYSRDFSRHNGELIFDKSKGLHSVREVARILDVPAQKIYYEKRSGLLKSHKRGAAWVIHIDDVQAYKESYLSRKSKEAI